MSSPNQQAVHPAPPLTTGLVLLFAFCCGAIVGNIYYAQPIIEMIAPDIGLSSSAASLIVSLTQVGYALGLFFLVPLADLLENRRLMIVTLAISAVSLVVAGLTQHATAFFIISALIGFSSVSVQMLIPLAAHMAPDEKRGRAVGTIMGGLLLGIMLARPLSSLVADYFGWRTVFLGAAALMVVVIVIVELTLPKRHPEHSASYGQLLLSLERLFRTEKVLRQRSLYQGLMFAAFSLFWTSVPLELAGKHHLSQTQIAIFALIGAVGAIAAPIAGRLADAGHTHRASWIAMTLAVSSFMTIWASPAYSLIALAVTAILLDFAVQMNMVVGQREVFALCAAGRARLNALYMTSIFIGGAAGSVGASWLYDHGGWTTIALVGSALPLIALVAFWMQSSAKKTTEMEMKNV